MNRSRAFSHVLLATILVLGGGCLYRVGSTLPYGLKTVFVPIFDNKADYPQLEFEVTSATIDKFQFDNTLKPVKTQDKADLVVKGKITELRMYPIAFNPDRTTTAASYRLIIVSKVTVTNRRANTLILDNVELRGITTFTVGSDLVLAKRLAIPDAAKDLGQRVVDAVTESW